MEGQILKAFDIKELFIHYDDRQLAVLVRDSFKVFKIDFKVDFKMKDTICMDTLNKLFDSVKKILFIQ